MIGFTSEITDKVSSSRWDHHLHLCPQMMQARKSALLKDTSWEMNPIFPCDSLTL